MSAEGTKHVFDPPTIEFQRAAELPEQGSERPRPFSVWLTPRQRSDLEALAGEMPLGAYIKARALGDGVSFHRRRTYRPVEDKQALARALALLGRSRLSSNLNQLAKAAHLGTLPVSKDTHHRLNAACTEVHELRSLLLHALGVKEGGSA